MTARELAEELLKHPDAIVAILADEWGDMTANRALDVFDAHINGAYILRCTLNETWTQRRKPENRCQLCARREPIIRAVRIQPRE